MTVNKNKMVNKKKKIPPKATVQPEHKILKQLVWIIPVVTLFVFSPMFNQEFINYDDDWMIYENNYVTQFSAESLKLLFSEFYMGQYSPVSMAMAGVVYKIGAGDATWFKVVALLMHLVNTILFFILLRNIFKSNLIAVAGMAFFALHPVQVESVAWLSAAYKVLVFSMFTLASLLCWERFTFKGRPLYYAGTLLFMILACFSKEQALIIPLFMLLMAWYRGAKLFSGKAILQYLPFVATSIVFVGVTYMAVISRSEVQLVSYTFPERIYYLTYSFILYFKILLFPANLTIFYGIPEAGTGALILFPVLTALSIFLLYRIGRDDKRVAWAIIFFFVSLLLTFALQLVSLRETLYADRYLYLGVPAFFILLYLIAEKYAGKKLQILFVIFLIIFSGAGYSRVKKFDNSETVWSDAIDKGYKSPLAYNNRGHYYRRQNQTNLAIRDYNEALRINPQYFRSWNNRGKIYFDQGQMEMAMGDFNKALSIAPDFTSALSNRGAAYASQGEFDLALADLNKAIELDPSDKNAYSNRALSFYHMGRFDDAISDVTTYLKLVPGDADMHNLRALAYRQAERYDMAFSDFEKAIQINPREGAFYQNRSFLHFVMGDTLAALNDIRTAQQLGLQVDENYLRRLTSGN